MQALVENTFNEIVAQLSAFSLNAYIIAMIVIIGIMLLIAQLVKSRT